MKNVCNFHFSVKIRLCETQQLTLYCGPKITLTIMNDNPVVWPGLMSNSSHCQPAANTLQPAGCHAAIHNSIPQRTARSLVPVSVTLLYSGPHRVSPVVHIVLHDRQSSIGSMYMPGFLIDRVAGMLSCRIGTCLRLLGVFGSGICEWRLDVSAVWSMHS